MDKLKSLCYLVAPLRFGASDGVQDDQQFMHAGHQGDLLGLGRGRQLGTEGLEHAIETPTYQGCVVQRPTSSGAPAKDVTPATHGARVAVDESRADQGGNFLAVELAQFGQLRGVGIRDLHEAGLGLGMGHARPLALGHQHGLQLPAPHHQCGEYLAQLGVTGLVVAKTQRLTFSRDGHVKAASGRIDPNVNSFTPNSSPVPNLTNPKCVRSTIRDTAEQRDHRSVPCAWKRARAQRRLKLHNGESTSSAIKPATDGLTTEV